METRIGEDPREWRRALQSRLDEQLVTELSGACVDRVTDAGDPAVKIVEFADGHAVDLIMMPTHGLGLFRSLLVGSVTLKVLHDAKHPVWTAAHADEQPASHLPGTILCAVDGSEESVPLARWATDFSIDVGASLRILHVTSPVTDWPSLGVERRLQNDVREQVHRQVEWACKAAGIEAPLRVAVGEIVATVTEHARQERADLLIIGRGAASQPLARLHTHVFGIIQRSPCPVLSA